MADQFSAQWWNDQAIAAGGLDKAAVERLTGQSYPVVWNADGTIPWDKTWPKRALIEAPGLEAAGLLLSPRPIPATYPYQTAEAAFDARDPNWGGWSPLVSPVGNVAPGTNLAYEPVLSPTYTPPATTPTPTTTTTLVPGSDLPPTVVTTSEEPSTSGAAPTQTFTGGAPQTGGGGEYAAPSSLETVSQTAAPGSQYVAPAPSANLSLTTAEREAAMRRRLYVGIVVGVVALLVIVWWFRRRRKA